MVTWDRKTRTLTKNEEFGAFSHVEYFVAPGARGGVLRGERNGVCASADGSPLLPFLPGVRLHWYIEQTLITACR